MLGLSSALGAAPYSSGLGSHAAATGSSLGTWQATGVDLEAELTNLKTSVDVTQRSLGQLENKLGARLENICRRHIDDALAASGPLQELRQGLSRGPAQVRATELEPVH